MTLCGQTDLPSSNLMTDAFNKVASLLRDLDEAHFTVCDFLCEDDIDSEPYILTAMHEPSYCRHEVYGSNYARGGLLVTKLYLNSGLESQAYRG